MPLFSLLALLLLAWRFSKQQAPLRTHFWWALSFKIASGLGVGIVYHYFYTFESDTLAFFEDGLVLRKLAIHDVGHYISFMLDFSYEPDINVAAQLINSEPRAWFMDKVTSLVCLFFGKNYWLCTLPFSFFCFVGVWSLANTLIKLLPQHRMVITFICLYYPSFVFWSAGILKESLLIGSIGFCSSWAIQFLYILDYQKYNWKIWMKAPLFVLLLFIIFEMKYYYFAAFVPWLLGLAFVERIAIRITRTRWMQLGLMGIVGIALLFAAQFVHPNLNLDIIGEIILENHLKIVVDSHEDNLVLIPNLQPTLMSVLKHAPQALLEGLFRPYFWEQGNILKKIASLESFSLLLLSGLALWQFIKRQLTKKSPFIWPKFAYLWLLTVFYFLLLASLLPIVAPNLGNLVRYRIGYAPILVGLLLGYVWKEKRLNQSEAVAWSERLREILASILIIFQ